MSDSKTCANCDFFEPNERSDGSQGGICRRYPPVPMLLQQNSILGSGAVGMAGVSPPVDPDFSCGEHRDSEKLPATGTDRYAELLSRGSQ